MAFTIKEDFLNGRDTSGFAALITRTVDDGLLDLRVRERYRHRVSTCGEPLHYVALVGTKTDHVPADGRH